MVVDDAAGDAAGDVPGDMPADVPRDVPRDEGGGANPGDSPDISQTRRVRRDSALETVLRAEAAKLARLHHNDDLTLAFGSPTNLAAEAQQGFIESRAQRYAKRQQTLLSGTLADWGDGRASLYTFISRAAANFLIDMYREFRAHGDGRHAQGATPANWTLAPAAGVAASHTHDADWLDAQHTRHAPSAQEAEEEAEEAASHAQALQALQALDAAVAKLPADLQMLVQLERSKAEHGLADSEIIRRMGLGSGNTLVARRKRQHAALRGLLGRPAGDERRPLRHHHAHRGAWRYTAARSRFTNAAAHLDGLWRVRFQPISQRTIHPGLPSIASGATCRGRPANPAGRCAVHRSAAGHLLWR